MMPLHDRDTNTVGRCSRASNMSATSQGPPKPRPPGMAHQDMLASAPGVMSMLKSSTELGADSLMMPGSRFSAQKRHSNRQSGTMSRLSTGSNRSQQSRPPSGQRGHHAWPSISSGGRRMSVTSNYSNIAAAQHYLDNMPPPSHGNLSDPASMPPQAPFYRDNGRSMSLTNSVHQHGSLANYRSLSSLRNHEPYPRPRSPYRYPTRLKRPGYRPASPAMSDVTIGRTHHAHHRPGSGLRMAHGAHGSQGSFRGGPFMPPGLRPQQMYHGPRDRSSPSVNSFGPLEYMPGMYPPSLPASRQGTPSIPDYVAPMMTPTSRMAGHSTPQSSDPPSSTPPTPANHIPLSMTEPTIVQTGPTMTRHGSAASATMPTYYDYSEQFETTTKDGMMSGTLPCPPTLGFVHRIRTILEERRSPSKSVGDDIAVVVDALVSSTPEQGGEVHELPASPVIKRITRDLIRSTLAPTSDVDYSVTPNSNTNTKSTAAGASSDAPEVITADVVDHARDRGASNGSIHGPTEAITNSPTAGMEYGPRYSSRSEHVEDGSTMSDFLNNYGEDDKHMTTVIEEPTEPVTIAMAELEVAAPTPTQPRWKPSFDTPPDILRTQSAVVASSVYSSGGDPDFSSRYSTPMMPTLWPSPPSVPPAQPIVRPDSNTSSLRPSNRKTEQGLRQQHSVNSEGVAKESKQDQLTQPPRPPSAASRKSRLEAVMPPSRPTSALERPSQLEPLPLPSRPPSAMSRISRQDQPAVPSRPPSAAERFSKQYQVILPPRPPAAALRELIVDRAVATSKPLPALPLEEARPIDRAASPVSPLSECDVNRFDTIAASPVSPLLSPELAMNKRDSNVSSIWSYRKPVPKRPDSPASISTRASVREPDMSVDQGCDRESTTDLRFSVLSFRPAVRQLDDVKEEPNLETSTVDLRASTFKFPLPQRKSSLAHYEEFRLSRELKRKASLQQAKAAAVIAGPSAAAHVQEKSKPKISPIRLPAGAISLGELRAIPSLHFSRTDLFSKLNEALDLTPDPPSDDLSETPRKSDSEQESTGIMRLKYRSFFESLDNMASDPPVLPQTTTEVKKASISKVKSPRPRKQVKLPKIQQWTPDDLMAEIDRLSIPSINGLTQRLSELLPSLRRYYGGDGNTLEQDETVKSALDEIRRLGAELIPELRESVSFTEGDSDDMYEDTSASSSSCQENMESTVNTKTRPRSASTPGEMLVTPLAELDGTPAVPRARSMSHGEAINKRDGVGRTDRTSSTRCSPVGFPAESRPWNLDTSYPWADSTPSIDIALPAPTLRRDPIKPRPSRLRLRDDVLETGGVTIDFTADTLSSDVTATMTAEHSYSRTTTHRRRTSKRSFLGSISRKLGGLSRDTSIDNSGYATGPELLRGHDDRTVDPGDRYPTTGLSPPSALNIDEVRSFFSDDSSHFETQTITRGGGLRKRFSNLKTKLPPMSRTHSALEQRPVPAGPSLRRSNSLFFARGGPKSMNLAEFDNHIDAAAGMPKTEVRAKKLVNRMKTLWYRGGELLRTLSGKRRPRESQNWDDDGESMVFPDE